MLFSTDAVGIGIAEPLYVGMIALARSVRSLASFNAALVRSFLVNLSSFAKTAPRACPFRKFHPAWDSRREAESSHDRG
jgi:hypothetical protein